MMIADMSIRNLVTQYTGAAEILGRFKIDFYRIGEMSLKDAVARQGLDLGLLKAAMSGLVSTGTSTPVTTPELISHIRKRQHVEIPNLLSKAIQMARRIENTHCGWIECPTRLGHYMTLLSEALEASWAKKDKIVSLKMLRTSPAHLRFPILRLILDNDEISDQLDTIKRLTKDFTASDDADANWQALNCLCALLDGELRYQMHLENNLLFPRFVDKKALNA